MHDGGHHALAAETIERPEQHAVEPALVGIVEQGGELLAFFGAFPAGLLVDVLMNDLMTSTGAPGPELAELVLRVLAFVVG